MAEKTEFLQAIDDAILDADSLERFINGSDSETVLTRLSAEYPTLQKAIKELFENGGLPATPFKTKNAMEASSLADGAYAVVVNDGLGDGLYFKELGEWIKSSYSIDMLLSEMIKDYFERSPNLFNEDTVTPDYYIDAAGNIKESGIANWGLTDYIRINPSQQYTMSGGGVSTPAFINVAYYTKNKGFINRDNISGSNSTTPYTFTTPSSAYYLRLNISNLHVITPKRMLVEGSGALDYEPYYVKLKTELGSTAMEQIQDYIKQVNNDKEQEATDDVNDKVVFNYPVNASFEIDRTDWEGYSDPAYFTSTEGRWDKVVTAAYVYSLYDSMMQQYPDYISKQLLGNDAWGNPISVYKLTPFRVAGAKDTKKAKVFLTCGVHGHEKQTALNAYLMMREFCNHWKDNEQLDVLRHNVEFLIIPVANPSGWDNFSRHNNNGVDINRNFPEGWTLKEAGALDYGGAEPLSELESQYIKQVFDENPDINIMYDMHNFSGTTGWVHYLWIPVSDVPLVRNMANAFCGRMLRIWRKRYDWLPNDEDYQLGYTQADPDAGYIKSHARGRGIKLAGTMEICTKWHLLHGSVYYDELHTKTSTEALINWILLNLAALEKLG